MVQGHQPGWWSLTALSGPWARCQGQRNNGCRVPTPRGSQNWQEVLIKSGRGVQSPRPPKNLVQQAGHTLAHLEVYA